MKALSLFQLFTGLAGTFRFATAGWANDRIRLRQTWTLGLIYLVGLFAYQLFSLILADENGVFQILHGEGMAYLRDRITLFLHLGMLTGAVGWSWLLLRQGATLNRVLNWSLLLSAASMAGKGILALKAAYLDETFLAYCLGGIRFVYGFGFSASLAIGLTLIVERFPAYLRTWSASVVCALGMLGPMLAIATQAITLKLLPNGHSAQAVASLLFTTGILILLPLLRKLPQDTGFSEIKEGDASVGAKHTKPHQFLLKFVFRDKNTSRIFWACVAMGLSVSIFSDLMNMLPRFNNLKSILPQMGPLPTLATVYVLRYSGMVLGTLYAGWESTMKRSRKRIILKLLVLQLAALVLLLLPVLGDFGNSIPPWSYWMLIFFSGYANGFWIIVLLHTAEQFARIHRRIANLLVLNLTRFGAFFIILLNNFTEDSWFNKFPVMLLLYGIVFISIGLFTAPFLPDSFHGNAVEADYDTQNRVFDNVVLRKKMLNISREIWLSEEPAPFLNDVNKRLFGHLSENLKENFYSNSLFFSQKGNRYLTVNKHILKTAGYQQNEQAFRQETYDYRETRISDGREVLAFQEGMQRLILDKNLHCSSLTLWIMPEEQIGSLLLWFGGPGQELNEQDQSVEGLRAFNLAKISLGAQVDLQVYLQLVSSPDLTMQERCSMLDDLMASVHFEETEWKQFFSQKLNPSEQDLALEEGIRRNVLLHRLNAELYRAGAYYAYYLKSNNMLNDLKGVFSLIMATALRERYIQELRGILTFVLLQRSAAMLQRSNELIIHEERHANKHELDGLVGRLTELRSWFSRTRRRAEKETFRYFAADEFEIDFLPAFHAARHMRDLTDYNNLLMRKEDLADAEAYSGEKDSLFARFSKVLDQEELDLKKFLLERIADLTYMPNAITLHSSLSDVEQGVLRAACLEKLRSSVLEAFAGIPGLMVRANPIGLRVVLHELLKNAGQHADLRNPEIKVRLNITDGGDLELHLINNWYETFRQHDKARKALYDAIQYRIEHEHSRSGLRTVQRFLECPWFSYGGKTFTGFGEQPVWRLSCADITDREATQTDIFIVIPASSVNTNMP